MDSLKKLQQLFKKFPGIGERQAMRFAYFITTANDEYVKELLENISVSRKNVRRCDRCFALSEGIVSGLCLSCRDPLSDKSTLLIVEKDADRERFLQSKTYKGTYFVLGGLAPAIEKDTHSHIRTKELIKLVETEAKKSLNEVILALSATPDGTRTELYLKIELEKISKDLKVTFLGRGLSTGTEIEYSDSETLKNALRSRTTQM